MTTEIEHSFLLEAEEAEGSLIALQSKLQTERDDSGEFTGARLLRGRREACVCVCVCV